MNQGGKQKPNKKTGEESKGKKQQKDTKNKNNKQ